SPTISPLSLHDALPIWLVERDVERDDARALWRERTQEIRIGLLRKRIAAVLRDRRVVDRDDRDLVPYRRRRDVDGLVVDRGLERSEEHTSELQSRFDLV